MASVVVASRHSETRLPFFQEGSHGLIGKWCSEAQGEGLDAVFRRFFTTHFEPPRRDLLLGGENVSAHVQETTGHVQRSIVQLAGWHDLIYQTDAESGFGVNGLPR